MYFVMTHAILYISCICIWLIIGILTLFHEATSDDEGELRLFESLFIILLWPIFLFLRKVARYYI
jgi:hypothetical protein